MGWVGFDTSGSTQWIGPGLGIPRRPYLAPHPTNTTSPNVTHTDSVASVCGPTTSSIVSMKRYDALLPPSFSRDVNPAVGYSGAIVNDDPFCASVSAADFVVFDQARGLELLGAAPRIERMFEVLNVIHEAPVYVPGQKKLYVAQHGPMGDQTSLVIDLSNEPSTMSGFETSPKTYQGNGGFFQGGSVYWAVMGQNDGLRMDSGSDREPRRWILTKPCSTIITGSSLADPTT
ncbi:MAG: hypothetical protein M1835_007910 [Candelina submexicana]|nr:MAG: hypothetical protein M1835_007910 [Candelina submexicana]